MWYNFQVAHLLGNSRATARTLTNNDGNLCSFPPGFSPRASSDPWKVARFRAASRARTRCAARGKCDPVNEPGIRAFDRLMIKVAEHTWGWNDGNLRTPRVQRKPVLANGHGDVGGEAAIVGGCASHVLLNTSCEKGAFQRVNVSSAAACCAACGLLPDCKVWEFASGLDPNGGKHASSNCHLKPRPGTIVHQTGTTCGSKSKFPPPPPPPSTWVGSYNNSFLRYKLATDPEYQTGVETWVEQRAFVSNAVAALSARGGTKSALAADIGAEFAALAPAPFDTTGFVDVHNLTQTFRCGAGLTIGFGIDGSIATLVGPNHHDWAGGAGRSLGRIWYNGFDADDEAAYLGQYLANWKFTNFGKPNLDQAKVDASATLVRLRTRAGGERNGTAQFLLSMTFPDTVHELRGAPAFVEALVTVNSTGARGGGGTSGATIGYTLQWRNKTACHVPETLWFSNVPAVSQPQHGWTVEKLGSSINPMDADLRATGTGPGLAPDGNNGSCGATGVGPSGQLTCGVNLHAVGEGGVRYASQSEGVFNLASPDVALVSLGAPSPFPQVAGPPDMSQGVHFAMVGNVWNTNYPLWYPFVPGDGEQRFRFVISIG